MYEKIQETTFWLKERVATSSKTATILGTGLGQLASEITDSYEFAYTDIPNFPLSMAEGHSGELTFGKLGDKDIMAMQGRFHRYEGYDMKEVTFPKRIIHELGTEILFVSSASEGTNPDFKIRDLMIIDDYIDFFPEHPFHGKNFPVDPRFPGMHEAYDGQLRALAGKTAKERDIGVICGVYVGIQGSILETPAEYRMHHRLGSGAVGMSTVPEVIAACHCGIKMSGMSIITDLGIEGQPVEVSYEKVQAVTDKAQPLITEIMSEIIERS